MEQVLTDSVFPEVAARGGQMTRCLGIHCSSVQRSLGMTLAKSVSAF